MTEEEKQALLASGFFTREQIEADEPFQGEPEAAGMSLQEKFGVDAPSPYDRLSEAGAEGPSTDWSNALPGMALSAMNTLTLENAPRIGAAGQTLLQGNIPWTGIGDFEGEYDENLARGMAGYERFQRENPGKDAATRLGTALAPLALPAKAAKLVGLAPANKLASAIIGKARPTYLATGARAGLAGGVDAAARAFSTAEEGEGIEDAFTAAPWGMGIGAGTGVAATGLQKLVGKLRTAGTPADEKIIMEQMEGIPEEELVAGQKRMRQAETMGQKMTPIDAVDTEQMRRLGRAATGFPETSAVGRDFLRDRALSSTGRMTKELNKVAPNVDRATAGGGLKEASKGRIKGAHQAVTKQVRPYYQIAEAQTPLIESEYVMNELTKKGDSTLRTYVAAVKRAQPSRLGQLPDNHFRVLNAAKKAMDRKAKLLARGEVVDADAAESPQYLRGEAGRLTDDIDNFNDFYKAGRAKHAKLIKPVETMREGQIGRISKVKPTSYGKIPAAVMNMTPQEITTYRAQLDAPGKRALRSAVRSFIQGKVAKDKTGEAALRYLMKGTDEFEKVKTILGPAETIRLQKFFENELQMARSGQFVTTGTQTAEKLGELGSYQDLSGRVQGFAKEAAERGVTGAARERLLRALLGEPSDAARQMNRKVAEKLFRPGDEGARLLEAIMQARRRTTPIIRGGNKFRNALIPAEGSEFINYLRSNREEE